MSIQRKMLPYMSALIFAAASISGSESVAATYTVSHKGPISTISRAIKIAKEGDTVRVEKGHYKERIVVDKPIKLIGIDRPVIDGQGKGIVVLIKAPGCTLKGFLVKGSGSSLTVEDAGIYLDTAANSVIEGNQMEDVLFGIYLKNSPGSLIRNNFIEGKDLSLANRGDGIRLWYSSDTRVVNNYLSRTRDLVIWFSNNTLIKGNTVEKGRYGLHYMYSNDNVFEDNVFTENFVGGFLMYSRNIKFYDNVFAHNQGPATGYGIGFKDLDDVVAERNLFMNNRIGLYLDNSPHAIDSWNKMKKNVIAFNDIGASFMPSIERNIFSGNNFIENTEQVEVRGGGALSGNKWSANEKGNYWSDYVGYDEDGDGIGEIPYLAESLFESFIDRYPNLRIFIFSPVSQAIEFASEAFPIMKPEPKVVDKHPMVDSHVPDEFKSDGANFSLSFLVASAFLALAPLFFYVYMLTPKRIK